jgi:site-specific DNA-cytosine methylase
VNLSSLDYHGPPPVIYHTCGVIEIASYLSATALSSPSTWSSLVTFLPNDTHSFAPVFSICRANFFQVHSSALKGIQTASNPPKRVTRQTSIASFFSRTPSTPSLSKAKPATAQQKLKSTVHVVDEDSDHYTTSSKRARSSSRRVSIPSEESSSESSHVFGSSPLGRDLSESDQHSSSDFELAIDEEDFDSDSDSYKSMAESSDVECEHRSRASSEGLEESVERPSKCVKPTARDYLTAFKPQKKTAVKAKSEKDVAKKAGLLEYQDRFVYRNGLDEERYPPISNTTEIFADQLKNFMKKSSKFNDAINHLSGRKLKVATMCSGTESPILALMEYREHLQQQSNGQLDLDFEHLFSAEIVPFKQAYIERNFNPPIIFRDVKELVKSEQAHTAYGALVDIPKDVDLLIAGFSCVDFSRLNSSNKGLEDFGESGDTFYSILDYCRHNRPRIVILENVSGAPWEKICGFWPEIDYAASWVRVDTKDFYLPQTRQRGYLIAIDKRAWKGAKAAVEQWKDTLTAMKRKASSGVEAFLLPSDDPRLLRAEEELIHTASEQEKRREGEWSCCESRHETYRDQLGLGPMRPLINWENGGSCSPVEFLAQKWLKNQRERIHDCIDISYLRNLSRGFDLNFKK